MRGTVIEERQQKKQHIRARGEKKGGRDGESGREWDG